MCTCFVVSDRPSFRKSIRLEFGHSESHGALSLFVEPRQLCRGLLVEAMLVWTTFRTVLFGFLRMSDFHFPTVRLRLNRACISHSYSIRLLCCSPSRPSRPKLSAHNGPAPPSARRPLALSAASSLSHVYSGLHAFPLKVTLRQAASQLLSSP